MMSTLTQAASLRLEQYASTDTNDLTRPLLAALLEFAPTAAGRNNVTLEITSCQDHNALYNLGQRYMTGLIIPMRASGGKTPAVSDHPSRPSAEPNEVDIQPLIEIAKRDQTMLKRLCLERDNYRCIISGTPDNLSWKGGLLTLSVGEYVDPTVAAHIIPFSVAAKDEKTASLQRTSAIFETLNRFGGVHINELNGQQINRVENILTLTGSLHSKFGGLEVWLEAVEGQQHTYRFRKYSDPVSRIPEGEIITFHSADSRIPLPDPRYLAIHAACAKVCHASGADEVIDKMLREYEETGVLPTDGSSNILEHALRMISVR